MAISTEYGLSPVNFGHADYGANISAGYNPLQILDYLNQNPDVLKGTNVPGGGGVYDLAMQEASIYQQQQTFQQQIEQQQAAQQAAIQQQQAAFQEQLAAQQQQAQQAQKQLMINMQRADRAPAAVKTASSAADKSGLTSRGTVGYFGRQGLRIGSLNVPSMGLAITPNMQMPVSGSFA